MATAGRSCSPNECAAISRRTSVSTTRVARFHNIYGPFSAFRGGREKAPAAICRKVIEAQMHRDAPDRDLGRRRADAQLHVHRRLPRGHAAADGQRRDEPLNVGSSELVSINELVDIVEGIAGVELARRYDLAAPKGVRGRNSDNTRICQDWAGSPPRVFQTECS